MTIDRQLAEKEWPRDEAEPVATQVTKNGIFDDQRSSALLCP
jgi:hypothetical protein